MISTVGAFPVFSGFHHLKNFTMGQLDTVEVAEALSGFYFIFTSVSSSQVFEFKNICEALKGFIHQLLFFSKIFETLMSV